MTSATASELPSQRLVHEALLFASDAELRARVVPFVREALLVGEPVIVVAGPQVRSVLLDDLGSDIHQLALFVDADEQWVGPAHTIAWYRDVLHPIAESGRSCRVVAEPTWMSQPWGAVWSRYDALVNDIFADHPCHCLCLHDRRTVPESLLEEALQVHPLVADGDATVPSPGYLPPADFLRSVEPAWAPAPEQRDCRTVSAAVEARSLVAEALAPASEGLRDDVTLAVNELVSNAITAAGSAEVSHWREGDSMVWEVADPGPGMHTTSAGYVPPPADELGGRGLWIARTLADDAVVRPHGPGTAIRLFFPAAS